VIIGVRARPEIKYRSQNAALSKLARPGSPTQRL
jgi:hypothetical protein